jgi:hypothetical protein
VLVVGNFTGQTVSVEGEPLLPEVEQIIDRLSQKLQQADRLALWEEDVESFHRLPPGP